jgi:predicted Na+-dependent transporter
MGLGTAHRNTLAAKLAAAQSFSKDPNVLVMVMLVAILGLILLGVVAGELGKRVDAAGNDQPAPA